MSSIKNNMLLKLLCVFMLLVANAVNAQGADFVTVPTVTYSVTTIIYASFAGNPPVTVVSTIHPPSVRTTTSLRTITASASTLTITVSEVATAQSITATAMCEDTAENIIAPCTRTVLGNAPVITVTREGKGAGAGKNNPLAPLASLVRGVF